MPLLEIVAAPLVTPTLFTDESVLENVTITVKT
jgi:hypothetical protein